MSGLPIFLVFTLVLVLCLQQVESQTKTTPKAKATTAKKGAATTKKGAATTKKSTATTKKGSASTKAGTTKAGAATKASTTPKASATPKASGSSVTTPSATTHTGSTHTGSTLTGSTESHTTNTETTHSTTTTQSVEMDDKCAGPTVEIPPFFQCVEIGCTARQPCTSPDLAGRYCCPHSVGGVIQNCCFSAVSPNQEFPGKK